MMSPWLFNMCMDGIVSELNKRVNRRGWEMVGQGGKVWRVNQIFYTNKITVLIWNSRENLRE